MLVLLQYKVQLINKQECNFRYSTISPTRQQHRYEYIEDDSFGEAQDQNTNDDSRHTSNMYCPAGQRNNQVQIDMKKHVNHQATQKLHEILQTPKKPRQPQTPQKLLLSQTPLKHEYSPSFQGFTSSTPNRDAPKAQQKLNYALATRQPIKV